MAAKRQHQPIKILVLAALGICAFGPVASRAQSQQGLEQMSPARAQVIEYWTEARRRAAVPMRRVVDGDGNLFETGPNGFLRPYRGGQAITAAASVPRARPGSGTGDTTPPVISEQSPEAGATVSDPVPFSVRVSDDSGLKSVRITVVTPAAQSLSADMIYAGDDVWTQTLSNTSAGDYSWYVTATDNAPKGGNTATSNSINFTVGSGGSGSGGGGGGGGGSVIDNPWTAGGAVEAAVGRIYFELPANTRGTRWAAYWCSGTAVQDPISGRSVILTAAHCVFDEVTDTFARNVLFIPKQGGTSGSATDTNCSNDPFGCWVVDFGVVDRRWQDLSWSSNIPYDSAFYVVEDVGSHAGAGGDANLALDAAVTPMGLSFGTPYFQDSVDGSSSVDFTHGLGYPGNHDPDLRYCADDLTRYSGRGWYMNDCGLGGGSSGGGWFQPLQNGTGVLISLNSYGPLIGIGMGGPSLAVGDLNCSQGLFHNATSRPLGPAARGYVITFGVNCNYQ